MTPETPAIATIAEIRAIISRFCITVNRIPGVSLTTLLSKKKGANTTCPPPTREREKKNCFYLFRINSNSCPCRVIFSSILFSEFTSS
jgi:hypothetical protein